VAKTDDKLEEELRTFELFRHIPKKELPRVAQLLGDPISVDAGHALTEQGRMESDVYLILDGTADVLVGGRPVAENGPGESVGEMAVVDKWPRSASVVARTPMPLPPERRHLPHHPRRSAHGGPGAGPRAVGQAPPPEHPPPRFLIG